MRTLKPVLVAGLIWTQAAIATPVTTPRGAQVDVVAEYPDGPGPFPAIVLAPGTGSRSQKINDEVASSLKAHGFAVYRFDWAYYVKDRNGTPSDTDRAPELEDFATVLALTRHDKRIDGGNILVGGKSRGTIIAWRIFREDHALRGILQLTPVCTKDGFTPDQLYPELDREVRPSLWISGDVDPACNTKTLYDVMSRSARPGRVAILRGNHDLASDATGALAAALATDFAAAATGR